MAVLLFLLSMLLGMLTILGLVIPNKILLFTANPVRSKSLLIFGLPAIILFFISMVISPTRLQIALENPLETTKLSLSGKKLEKIPDEVTTLVNLEYLDLSRNQFDHVPALIKNLVKLKTLDLSDNPIKEIPEWVFDQTSLKKLILDNTSVTKLPTNTGSLTILYENTPLSLSEAEAEQQEVQLNTRKEPGADQNDGETESLTAYALRSILTGEEWHRLAFKKGEVFYEHPVKKEEADQLGRFFVGLDYFNDENNVSVILHKTKEAVYQIQMVVHENQLNENALNAFAEMRKWIKEDLFKENSVEIHLIDGKRNLIKKITE